MPTLQELLKDVRKTYPALQWKHARFIDHGQDHVVVVLDGKTILRFPRTTLYKKTFPLEVALLADIGKKLPLTVPLYHLIPSHKRFAGYKKVEGIPLSLSRVKKRSTKKEREQYAKQIALFLKSLHSLKTSVPIPSEDLQKNWKEYLSLYKRYAKGLLDPATETQFMQALKPYEIMIKKPLPRCITHGDLSWRHILWNSQTKKVTGCIDFGDTCFDDPAADFCYLHQYSRQFLSEVFDAYGADQAFRTRAYLHLLARAFRALSYGARDKKPWVSFVVRDIRKLLQWDASLHSKLAKVTPENRHTEFHTGSRVGKEIW